MGWFGPSGNCGCCGGGPCCRAWFLDLVARWTQISSACSRGIGVTEDLVIPGNSSQCARSTVDTEDQSSSWRELLYGPESCPDGWDFASIGVFLRSVTGVAVSIQAGVSAQCDVDDSPIWTLSGILTYNVIGSIDCNSSPEDGCDTCAYALPRPVDDLGYSVAATNGVGTPISWSKANGANRISYIFADDDPPRTIDCCGGITKFERYSIQDTYSISVTDLDVLPTSFSLGSAYNPASITGTVDLL